MRPARSKHPEKTRVREAMRHLRNALESAREFNALLRDGVVELSPETAAEANAAVSKLVFTCGQIRRHLIPMGECPKGGQHIPAFTEVIKGTTHHYHTVCARCSQGLLRSRARYPQRVPGSRSSSSAGSSSSATSALGNLTISVSSCFRRVR